MPQVVLINAVKDVAKALGNLISTTKAAAGKPHDDPSMLHLKNSAKVKDKRTFTSTVVKGLKACRATLSFILTPKGKSERRELKRRFPPSQHQTDGLDG